MRDVFDLFRHDVGSEDDKSRDSAFQRSSPDLFSTVLIGSPGVGTSVIFFLAALFQAQSSFIVYYRRTNAEKFVSLFLMMPCSENSVRILYTRQLKKGKCDANGGLVVLHNMIDDLNEQYLGEVLYSFVDGPRHSDSSQTLAGTYDYFCTSGGHPLPKQEQESGFRIWVLSGWTEGDSMAALNTLYGLKGTTSERLYRLCGGCIRKLQEALADYDSVKHKIDNLISRLSMIKWCWH